MLRSHRALVLSLLLTVTGCGETPSGSVPPAASGVSVQTTAPGTTPSPAAAHAVSPGSYEDWCGEHAVPESACTRCDPKLIPAFKATKDWCAEHGLPESQCLKCNPTLKIQRPAKAVVH